MGGCEEESAGAVDEGEEGRLRLRAVEEEAEGGDGQAGQGGGRGGRGGGGRRAGEKDGC